MATTRRTHLTDVGSIACSDLDSLGAGEREGWLDDPSLLAALHHHPHHALALANAARSLVLTWDHHQSSPPVVVKIRPSLSPDDGTITAVEWIAFHDDGDLLALAVGTSAGSLLIYSPAADLIHKQIVYPGRVLRLRFRETKGGDQQDSASGELCVVMPGAIARFDGSDLQSVLQRWSREAGSRMWGSGFEKAAQDEDSFARIPFQIWSVSKYGSCTDAAISGLMPPPLLELQVECSLDLVCVLYLGAC